MRGRNIAPSDTAQAHRGILVNEAFARKHFPGADAIGRRIDHFLGDDNEAYEIVGVIGNVHTAGLDKEPAPQIVIPNAENPLSFMRMAVRTSGRPMDLAGAVRTEVMSIDDDEPFANPRTLESIVENSVGQRRFQMLLLTLFGAVAVVLAALGIYGVIAYSVEQRSREFGIRMALGAQASEVLRMVVAGGLRLALVGVLVGLAGAFALTHALSAALWQVSATDPLTYGAVAALVLLALSRAGCRPAASPPSIRSGRCGRSKPTAIRKDVPSNMQQLTRWAPRGS